MCFEHDSRISGAAVLTPPPDDRAFDVIDACAHVHPR